MKSNKCMKLFIVFIFLSLHPGAFAQSESYQKIVRVLEKAHKGDKLSATEMKSFLCAYEKEYINNTELGEYRNETLFQVIASDNASFFLSLLKKKRKR